MQGDLKSSPSAAAATSALGKSYKDKGPHKPDSHYVLQSTQYLGIFCVWNPRARAP